MSKLLFTIPNISCGHCVHTIKTELMELAGVKQVEASSVSKEVSVEFESPADEQQIRALLVEINYPPEER